MGVESATYINDLDSSLPASTDVRSQGDDHFRMVKAVLKAQFTGATRAFQIPSTLSKTADYTVLKTDGESTIYVTTAAGTVTLTMPSLVAGDAGWKVHFVKTNSGANPIFVAPSSGTLNSGGVASLAKARRSVPGVRVTVIWDGTGFFVTRTSANPIGTLLDFGGAALPAGYEWPNGQTLASASTNYPEYNSANGDGTTLDVRGRVVAGKDDMGGSAAGRLTSTYFGTSAAVLGAVGGLENHPLTVTEAPTGIVTFNASATHAHDYVTPTSLIDIPIGSGTVRGNMGQFNGGASNNGSTTSTSTGDTLTDNAGGAAHNNVQPTIICNKILVVE